MNCLHTREACKKKKKISAPYLNIILEDGEGRHKKTDSPLLPPCGEALLYVCIFEASSQFTL